jgi:hypothetical protein
MRKLKKYGFVPNKLVTDDLRSYAAAAGDLGNLRACNHDSRGQTMRRNQTLCFGKSTAFLAACLIML